MYLHLHYRICGWLAVATLATLIAVPGRAIATDLHGCDSFGIGCDCPGCDAYFDAIGGAEGAEGFETIVPGANDMSAPGASAPADLGADASLLATNFGATAGGSAAVPSMIGDFFGNNYRYAFINPNGTTVATAGGARHFKYAENTNPFPTDRVFFNYHFFNDPLLDERGRARDLSMFTFGIEKAFLNDRFSVEFRVPFGAALNSEQSLTDTNEMAAELGNLTLATKVLLYRDNCKAIAAGLGIVFPAGNDSVVTDVEYVRPGDPDYQGPLIPIDRTIMAL